MWYWKSKNDCMNNLFLKDKEGLGLSQEDFERIVNNVHVVINCAGSVDFNSRLDSAIRTNVLGTLGMLDLCKKIKNLQNFVHVSTCYVNCDKKYNFIGYVETHGFLGESLKKKFTHPLRILMLFSKKS